MTTSPNKTQVKPFEATTFPIREARTGASKRGSLQVAYTHPNTKKIPSSIAPASVQPYFTSASSGPIGIASDTAWAARTAIEFLPGPGIGTRSGVIADQTTGSLSMMNAAGGIIGLYQNSEAFRGARAIDDTDGATAAGINLATSAAQTGFGTATIGARSATIASALAPTKTGLTTAAAFFSFIANIFTVPLFAFLGGWGAFQSHRAQKFYKKAVQNQSFKTLVASLYVPQKDVKEMIKQDGISLRLSGLKAAEKALGTSDAETLSLRYSFFTSAGKKRALLEKVLTEHFLKDYPELLEMKEFYFSRLDERDFNRLDLSSAIGLLLKLRKMQLKNQAAAERALGGDQLQKIQRAAAKGLEARLTSTDQAVVRAANKEWTVLKAGIEASYAKTQSVYKATALLGLFGTVVGILTFVLTGPAGALVLLGLTFTIALACAIYDVCTHETSGQPGRFDKLYLGIGITLATLSIAATVGTFLFFGGSVPIMVLSVALASVLLGILIYHYRAINQQEKRWKAGHPDVQDLLEHLEQHQNLNSARKLFKQLPKEVRIGITDEAAQTRRKKRRRYTKMNPIDKEKYQRAVKNSAAFFWKQWWYSSKDNYYKEQAVLLERLALSIQLDRIQDSQRTVRRAHIQIIDTHTRAVLSEQIHRIFAREESPASLYNAAKRFSAA